MITRKRKRFSYAEASSDEEGADKKPSTSFTITKAKRSDNADDATFRGRVVYSRSKQAKRSKRPSFNYAKIFDLPTDILLMILEQLEAPSLWAVATSSEALQALLASVNCRGVWNASFINWKAHELQRHSRYDHVCGDFQYYGFRRNEWEAPPTFDAMLAAMNESDHRIYRTSYKLPLAPPACHPGISEYDYAKFLFTQTCDLCGCTITNFRYQTVVWEFAQRICSRCITGRTKTWSSLLTQKQQSVKGDFDDVKELLDFTEFLCYEPYAVGHHTGEAPSLQGRMLVFLEEDTSEELTKRFQLFRSKKHELSAPDFKVWCEAKNDEHEKRRQWGRHLQEFAVIRELYDKYLRKKEQDESVASRAAQRQQLLTTLSQMDEFSRIDLAVADKWSPPFRKLLSNKNLLSEDAGPSLRTQLFKYTAEILGLLKENKHWIENIVGHDLESIYSEYTYHGVHKSQATLPLLSPSDLWTLAPCRTIASKLGFDYSGEVRNYKLHSLFANHASEITEMAKLRAAVIRDQLLDSLLDRQTDPDHATEPTDHKGQAYDTWIVAKLNHPASLFRCEACKTICCWKTIVRHPCAVNDLDYASYDALFAERNKTLCKPVGFKIERVTAPVEFPRLFEIMSAAVSLVTKDREWRYDTFKIPTTVEQTQGVAAKSWLFSCTLDTCKDLRCTEKTAFFRRNRTYRQNWHDMMLHLHDKIENGFLKLEDLKPADIRVYAGIEES